MLKVLINVSKVSNSVEKGRFFFIYPILQFSSVLVVFIFCFFLRLEQYKLELHEHL